MQTTIKRSDPSIEILSTITAQGQITLPAEVRKRLGLSPNNKVAFVIQDSGEVKVTAPKYPNVSSLRGAAGSLSKPLSWDAMKKIAMEDRLKIKYSA